MNLKVSVRIEGFPVELTYTTEVPEKYAEILNKGANALRAVKGAVDAIRDELGKMAEEER